MGRGSSGAGKTRAKRGQIDTGYFGVVPDDELDTYNKNGLSYIIG